MGNESNLDGGYGSVGVGLRKGNEMLGMISILLLEHFVKGCNGRYSRNE